MAEWKRVREWPGWTTKGLIGRSSRAEVYEIERTSGGQTEKAALKVISLPRSYEELLRLLHGSSDARSAAEALLEQKHIVINEYAMMRQMSGAANFVNCEDMRCVSFEDRVGWDICIKMELLTPLAAAMEAEPTEETVLKIGTDLCRALALCGRYGLVHRNIKPQNIFLSRDGAYKLGDFALSETAEGGGAERDEAANFAAPEVLRGEPCGHTADLYSLGLVLYWLLNELRLPFVPLPPAVPTAEEVEKARLRRLAGERLPLPLHGSPELRRIVCRACDSDPAKRYQSAEEMLEALSAVRPGKAGAIRTAGKTAAPAAASASAETAKPAEPRKKSRGFLAGILGTLLLLIVLLAAALTLGRGRIFGGGEVLPSEAPPPPESAAPEETEQPPDTDWIESFAAGDLVSFGSYEQDGDTGNGPEAIRWIVLERSGTELTLLSSRCLDTRPFHSGGGSARWEESELRRWLNEEFYSQAFTEEQRAAVVETMLNNPANPEWGVGEGGDTADRVYLLSLQELERYFPAEPGGSAEYNAAAEADSTPYAIKNGAFRQEENKNTWWWLRTTGKDLEHAVYVYSTGLPAINGGKLASSGGGLRPALRVDLALIGRAGAGLEKAGPREIAEAQKGDTVLFGSYEQNGDGTDGPEPLEWIVLERKNDRLLLLSRNCLEAAAFHGEQTRITWGDCALRAWLNGDFLETAFSAQERSLLIAADQKMKPNPNYDTYLGRNTTDAVFLLSFDEVQKYLPAAANRHADGLWSGEAGAGGLVRWWLRTPGMDRSRAMFVSEAGDLDYEGAEVGETELGVRPAIWLSVD